MIIASSNLTLNSSHLAATHRTQTESLVEGVAKEGQAWSAENLRSGVQLQREARSSSLNAGVSQQHALLESGRPLQEDALAELREQALSRGGSATENSEPAFAGGLQLPALHSFELGEAELQVRDADPVLSVIRSILEAIFGEVFQVFSPIDLAGGESAHPAPEQTVTEESVEATPQADRWGLRYHYEETVVEQESMQFQAAGNVQTADGESINISIDLNMSRTFASHEEINIAMGAALKDPLVINFDGGAAELTQRHFEFDIDADGTQDQIAFVKSGSGFLALDRNQDGEINDGRELFGALSGNGFEDLAALDDDSNGWIDEADSVFSKLRIWTRGPDNTDHLIALGQAGVGAIYLGYANTPFSITDQGNDLLGEVRASGVFLGENGGSGTVQQIDLVA